MTMTGINPEIRNRIRLSIAAYAYEFKDDQIMSDAEFDELALKIKPEEKTGNLKLDNFFKKHFQPDTGILRTSAEPLNADGHVRCIRRVQQGWTARLP